MNIKFYLLLSLAAAVKQSDFGPIECIPGWQNPDRDPEMMKNIISGWGNCHDPTIGEANAGKKMCAQSQVDETTVEWRCTCSHVWPLIGPRCEEKHPQFWPMVLIWLSVTLINAYEFYRSTSIAYYMYYFAGKKWNAANISAVLISCGMFSETMRYFSYLLRAFPGGIDDEMFEIFLVFAPISAIFITESYMGLGLAWLDIAVKSSAKGGMNSSYRKRKLAVRLMMGTVFIVCWTFYFLGRGSLIGQFAILIQMIIAPVLSVGGRRLMILLRTVNRNDVKKEGEMDLPAMIKTTVIAFLVAFPVYVIFALLYTVTMKKVYNIGERNLLQQVITISIFGLSATFTAHKVLNFFEESNTSKRNKMKAKSSFGGRGMFNSSILGRGKRGSSVAPGGISTLFSRKSSKKSKNSQQSGGSSGASISGGSSGASSVLSSAASSTASSTASSAATEASLVSEVSEVSGFESNVEEI